MENLGIDYKMLIAQVVNFTILFFLFRKFIAKPFINFLQEEKKKEESKERILGELENKHERMLEEEKAWRKKIKQEHEKLFAQAKQTAEKTREELLRNAKQEAGELLEKAKKQLEAERDSFYKESKNYIATISISIIQKALKRYLTEDVQKKLTDQVLTDLNKDRKLYEN